MDLIFRRSFKFDDAAASGLSFQETQTLFDDLHDRCMNICRVSGVTFFILSISFHERRRQGMTGALFR
jgi:hypothetical protein